MFTNTGSVSKTKHNLTYRMGQKLSSKLLTNFQIFFNGAYSVEHYFVIKWLVNTLTAWLHYLVKYKSVKSICIW